MSFEVTPDATSFHHNEEASTDFQLIERCSSFLDYNFFDEFVLLPYIAPVATATMVSSMEVYDVFGEFHLLPYVAPVTRKAISMEDNTLTIPMRGRRRAKIPVSEAIKHTSAYKERRRKNTAAAQRNRDFKLALADKDELPMLKKKNVALCAERDRLLAQIAIQRSTFLLLK